MRLIGLQPELTTRQLIIFCYTARMSALIYAVVAALSLGLWTVFSNKAAGHVNQALGAVIISAVAVVFGLVVFFLQKRTGALVSNKFGLLFILLAGLAAFLLDYATLKAYNGGLGVTVGGPIIIGGSIALAAVIGFFMGETFTWLKLLGILLVIGGSAMLAAFQK